VKERIFKYLQEAGRGVAATEILNAILNIRTPTTNSADRVVAGFLGQDPRFACAEGLWHLKLPSAELTRFDFSQAVILYVRSPSRTGALKDLWGAIQFVDTHLQGFAEQEFVDTHFQAEFADTRFQEFTKQTPINILGKIRSEISEKLLVAWSSRELQLWNAFLHSKGLEAWRGDRVYLRNLAARVLMRIPSKLQPEDLASVLCISLPDEARPREVLKYLNACWLQLIERVPAELRRNFDSLQEWMDGPKNDADFSHFAFGPSFLRRLPRASGVYIMKDGKGTVLYVGKSRNLKRRVSSYFTPRALCHPKIARIYKQLHSIEIRRTANEIEALLLEMRLIKDLCPAINMQTEIHQRQAGSHEGLNILLFVLEGGQKRAKIYFLRNGIFAGRCSALMGHPPSERLQDKVESLFFTQGRRRKRQNQIWEKEIVFRWFKANQRRINYLDVDEVEGFIGVLARLQHYLHDPDQLTYKVYYR
jgi:hypothetical protein